ncbi:MAG: hypothetical protein WCZ18_08985 [Ottowia sp.]
MPRDALRAAATAPQCGAQAHRQAHERLGRALEVAHEGTGLFGVFEQIQAGTAPLLKAT